MTLRTSLPMRAPYSSMYTDSTNTSTMSKPALTASVSSAAAERHERAAAFGELVLQRLQRRLSLLCQLHVNAEPVQVALQGEDRAVGFVDEVGQAVRERPHLIGDRVGEQHADPGQRQEESEVHREHRQTPGKPRALEKGDSRVEDQRDDRRHDEDQQHFARRFRQRPDRQHRQREQHQLDPARNDDVEAALPPAGRLPVESVGTPLLLGLAGPRRGCSRRRRSLARNHRQSMAEPEAAPPRPPSAVSILFVGDLVGRHRQAHAARLPADTARALRPRLRRRQRARTSPAGWGSPPRSPMSCFAAGVDAITLGNHTYHRREIYPYLEAQPRIVRPANFLRSQPGRGTCVVEHEGLRLGVVSMSGNLYLRAGRSAFTEIEVALGELGERRPRARGHARRGDLREGRRWAGTSTDA